MVSKCFCLVNTFPIQNSLLCVACFGNVVMQWESQCPLADRFCCVTRSIEASHIWQTILIFHCIYLMNILRPLPAKLEHFYLFDPCRAKNLTFISITTKRYFVDKSKYRFFFNRYNKRNLLVWSSTTSNFWIWSLYKLFCDPQAFCTGCDPAAIWNSDPWTYTNIMKLSNLLFLFSWLNFASV